MGRVAVIAEQPLAQGFGLAGALVIPARSPDEARAAWAALPDDVAVVLLSAAAAAALGPLADESATVVTAVMPG